MGILVFCDVDENGKIIESYIGDRIIPMKQYDYFFYLLEDQNYIVENIPNYRVVDGKLTLTAAQN